MDRATYQREWQRRSRAANPERAKAESRHAYALLTQREAEQPALKEHRVNKQREWVLANLERLAIASRRYYDRIRANPAALEAKRARQRQATARYNGEPRHRQKVKARWRASRALRDGRLKRRPCELCGAERSEMHHDDYSQPLIVRWLCKAHHERTHV